MIEGLSHFHFPENIADFSFTEYLITFVGLIFAIAVAEFFISIGKLLKEWKRTIFYWEFYLWIFVLLDLFILTWYVSWVRFEFITDGLFLFFLFIIPNLLIFLITSIYFPSIKGKNEINLKDHFIFIRPKFFILFSLYSLFNIILDLMLDIQSGYIAIITASVYLGFGILNAFFSSYWLRSILVCLFLIQFIALMILI